MNKKSLKNLKNYKIILVFDNKITIIIIKCYIFIIKLLRIIHYKGISIIYSKFNKKF